MCDSFKRDALCFHVRWIAPFLFRSLPNSMAEPANSSPGSTDRTERSNYTSSAVSGYGISPSRTATAAKSSAKSYPTPEDYSKAYYSSRTDYSGTERSRTDYSGTERSRTDYSGTERSRTDYSGTERSRTDYTERTYSEEYSADEQDAAYSDYSDHYSYSESSGPPSARPAATLMEGVRLFLGAVDEAFTRFAQPDDLAPAEPPLDRSGGRGRREGLGAVSGGEAATEARRSRRDGACRGRRRRGCGGRSRTISTPSNPNPTLTLTRILTLTVTLTLTRRISTRSR